MVIKTALHIAVEVGHVEVVQLLLEAGADKNATIAGALTALDLAAMQG